MKKIMWLLPFLLVFASLGWGWSFLQVPTARVIPAGEFQWSSVNLFSPTSWKIGIGGFSQFGIEDSNYVAQFQLLKESEALIDTSVGMKIGFDGKRSVFLAMAKNIYFLRISAALAYNSSESTQTSIVLKSTIDMPTRFGNLRFEYAKGDNVNMLAGGVYTTFRAANQIKWLFNSISIGVGLGWNFNDQNVLFPSTSYFVFQYAKSWK